MFKNFDFNFDFSFDFDISSMIPAEVMQPILDIISGISSVFSGIKVAIDTAIASVFCVMMGTIGIITLGISILFTTAAVIRTIRKLYVFICEKIV